MLPCLTSLSFCATDAGVDTNNDDRNIGKISAFQGFYEERNVDVCRCSDSHSFEVLCTVTFYIVAGFATGLFQSGHEFAIGFAFHGNGNFTFGNHGADFNNHIHGLEEFSDTNHGTGVAVAAFFHDGFETEFIVYTVAGETDIGNNAGPTGGGTNSAEIDCFFLGYSTNADETVFNLNIVDEDFGEIFNFFVHTADNGSDFRQNFGADIAMNAADFVNGENNAAAGGFFKEVKNSFS